MFKLFKLQRGGEIALNMDRIDSVTKSSGGRALVFYAGSENGVELEDDFDSFIYSELGIE